MYQIVELLLKTLKARASYSTRVWMALFFPLALSTILGASFRVKAESLGLGIIVAAAYSAACLFYNKCIAKGEPPPVEKSDPPPSPAAPPVQISQPSANANDLGANSVTPVKVVRQG